ncbi:helix-turn-helix transcriptional regulator [Burkholderia glumae]|uniref:helix-turn-helix transcriptional regulator n=1 Tax=Burkholderia glumae TaxID=337 RepID=UPI0001A4B105|nr:phage integrase family protein [Burkholderia glumae]ACR28362.1 Phage integrase family protein [Burkholderia glumae BGR1]AJY66712.1 phage integrase family protein [Burkholderia glumae LMG 2196 = ATCC 33617]QHE09463.1 DNA-binding protein [Burkholderia glumae AU6208]QKM46736.1 hypothetical protein B7760_00737 [Burkholderia glumae]
MTDTPEVALTLQQVADRLQLSYSTVFAMRRQIGFRMPGSRLWRVWPSDLARLSEKRNNPTRLSLRVGGDGECQFANIKNPASGTSISARQTARVLDDLLKPAIERRRRSTTIG